jgi:hypothetical protein
MLVNLYGDKGLIFQALASGFKEAHLQDKVKFEVVEADKVGAKFKDAVKEAYSAKFLDDADMVIRFAEPVQAQPTEEEPKDEEPAEQQPPAEEGGEQENAGAEADGQDENSEQAPEEKSDDGKKDDEKKENVSEAETTASGADLKKKVIDTIKRCLFQEDADKIELSDLEGYLDGYNVFFTKVSLKDDAEAAPSEQA